VSVVRADVVGRTANLASYGTSGIVDPDGVVLAAALPGMTGLIVADIETAPGGQQGAPPNRRHALRFMSHWFYNISGFGWRSRSAPVGGVSRTWRLRSII
jgi:hypothetical protein